MKNNRIEENQIEYDSYLANLYDYLPTFGLCSQQTLKCRNKPYIDGAKITDGQILEFGTATGKLTIPLAREGFNVSSVDISPYMHNIVRDKMKYEERYVADNIRLILDDAIKYVSDTPYDMIAIPDGMFIALSNQKLQLECLNNCYKNLRSGGRLYFDIAKPITVVTLNANCLSEHDGYTTYTRFWDKNRIPYIVTITAKVDPFDQYCELKYDFKQFHGKEGEMYPSINISYRYIHYGELVLMLEYTGFNIISIDKNFLSGRFFFVIAEKKQS